MADIIEKKKVAYLLEYPIDLPGGAQMSTESLCRGIVENGDYEPVVVCPKLLTKKAEDYPFRIVTYEMGDGRIKNLITRIFAFRRILKVEKPDIVHIQMPESLITYGLAGAKRPSEHMIFTDRGLFYGYRKHSLTMMKFALKKAELMLTTTEFNRKMWLAGTKIRPILKVANTISDRFTAYEPSKRADRNPGEPIRIGMAGRICEEKDWPFAVSLIKEIAKAGIDIKVNLVLSVFEASDDAKVRDIIDGISAAIGKDNLIFGQDLSQAEMSEYYYDVDVFIMTSCFESFGKAAVEAMSRKCAVISTEVGGLPEVIGRSENLYTKDSVAKAVSYIKRAYEDADFLKAEQEYFYNRYIDNFSQDRCIRDHIEIYESILDRRGN